MENNNNSFLKNTMEELIANANEIDKKTLVSFNKMVGSPITVEEFIEGFYKSVNENTPKQTVYFKMIEKFALKEFFPVVINILSYDCNNIQAQTVFKSTVAISDDELEAKRAIELITQKICVLFDAEVMYHGVCLLYRIITKYPQLQSKLEENQIKLGNTELDACIKRFNILYMWQTKNHRGKLKSGYFNSLEEFMDFALTFVKFN